jgi:hypothetical protein
MDAEYYRRLARELMADAAAAEDHGIAARHRERAQEYLIIAKTLEDADRRTAPPRKDGDKDEP